MKNKIIPFLLVALLGLSVTGCANSTKLDPAGVYAGDATLFNADQVIVGTYDVFNTFVTWEYTNRLALSGTPAIKQAADNVRAHGQQWIQSASALRDAYKVSPTADGKTKLLAALTVLQAALNEIAAYYAFNLKPPAPPASPTSGIIINTNAAPTYAIQLYGAYDPAAIISR